MADVILDEPRTDGADVIDSILSRCTEDGDCMIWQGQDNHGRPAIYPGKCSVRRIVYTAAHGSIPEGRVISVSCGQIACLEPEHLVARTISEVRLLAAADLGAKAKRSARMRRAGRAKSSLDIDKVRAIRAAVGSLKEIGEQFGLKPAHVSSIRTGRIWKEAASPWAGLGAR